MNSVEGMVHHFPATFGISGGMRLPTTIYEWNGDRGNEKAIVLFIPSLHLLHYNITQSVIQVIAKKILSFCYLFVRSCGFFRV